MLEEAYLQMLRLLLVEGMPRYEHVDEVEALAKALDIMRKSYGTRIARSLEIKPCKAETKEDFLRSLEEPTDFLHISCHGESKGGLTELHVMNGGIVRVEDIKRLSIRAKVVFANACEASRKSLAEAFLGAAGKRRHMYYIAPYRDVYFDEAFLAALLFYKREFIERTVRLSQALERNRLEQTVEYLNSLPDITTKYNIWEKKPD